MVRCFSTLAIALFLWIAVMAYADEAPCPPLWNTTQYKLQHVAANDYDERFSVPYGWQDVYATAGVELPRWPMGIFADGVLVTWLRDVSVRLNFTAGARGAVFVVPVLGSRLVGRFRFDEASFESYQLQGATVLLEGGCRLVLDVGGFPRVRVFSAGETNAGLSVRLVSMGGDAMTASPVAAVQAVVGVALPPIRLAVYRTNQQRILVGNISMVVSLTVSGATSAEVLKSTVTSVEGGDVVVSNVRFTAMYASAMVSIDVPESVRSAVYPSRPFRFPVRVSLRSADVARVDNAPHSDACTAAQTTYPLRVAKGALLPPIAFVARDSSGRVAPPVGTVATLCFLDYESGETAGSCRNGAVVGGIVEFAGIYADFGRVGRTIVGRAVIGGITVLTNTLLYAPSDVVGTPSRLAWDEANDQFYSSACPMVATSGVPMPPIALHVVDSKGLPMLAGSFEGLGSVYCEGAGATLMPVGWLGQRVTYANGAVLLGSLTFRTSTTFKCRLVVSVRIGAMNLTIQGAMGAVYAGFTQSVALSFARHPRLSFVDLRARGWQALLGRPLPAVTLLVRNSDWSVDRTDDVSVATVNATECVAGNTRGVAARGELHFGAVGLSCVGVARLWFARASAPQSAVPQLLYSGPIVVVRGSVVDAEGSTTPVYQLGLQVRGLQGHQYYAEDAVIVRVGSSEATVVTFTAIGVDGVGLANYAGAHVAVTITGGLGGALTPLGGCRIEVNGSCSVSWSPQGEGVATVRGCIDTPTLCTSITLLVAVTYAGVPRVVEYAWSGAAGGRPLRPDEPWSVAFAVTAQGEDPMRTAQASWYTPMVSAGANGSSLTTTAFVPATGGIVTFPRAWVADASGLAVDGTYAPLVGMRAADEAGVGTRPSSVTYHPTPVGYSFDPPTASDGVTVYVSARYKTFNAGRWIEELAGVLQLEAERVHVFRINSGHLAEAGQSCTVVELAFTNPTTSSAVKKSSAIARRELLDYRHLCSVPEKLKILHVKPMTAVAPFCEVVALQEAIEAARLCENTLGRDLRCSCFSPIANSLPQKCMDTDYIGAVCVHLASCRDGSIQGMCSGVRPNMALQVVEVVLATAAVMIVSMCIINYSFIIEYMTMVKQRLRKSRIVGPRQHHDEVFITAL